MRSAACSEIVAASRYAPRGLRGNGGLSASTEFETGMGVAERRAHAAPPAPEVRAVTPPAGFDRDQAEQRLRHLLPPDSDA